MQKDKTTKTGNTAIFDRPQTAHLGDGLNVNIPQYRFASVAQLRRRREGIFVLIGILMFPIFQWDTFDVQTLIESSGTSAKIVRLIHLFLAFFWLLRIWVPLSMPNVRPNIKKSRWVFLYRLAASFFILEIASITGSWVFGIDHTAQGAYHVLIKIVIIASSARILREVASGQMNTKDIFGMVCFWGGAYSIFIMLIVSVLAILVPNLATGISDGSRSARLGGVFIHPNILSSIFSFGIFSFFYLKRIKILGAEITSFFAIPTLVAGILWAQSRTALAAVIGCFFLYYVLRVFSKQRVVVCLALLIAITAGMAVAYKIFIENDTLDATGSAGDRIYIYMAAIDGIGKNPWFGVGYVDGVRQYLNDNCIISSRLTIGSCHNMILDCLLSRGILFSIPYFFISLFMCYFCWSVIRGIRGKENVVMVMFCIFIGVNGMTSLSAAGHGVEGAGVMFYLISAIVFSAALDRLRVSACGTAL